MNESRVRSLALAAAVCVLGIFTWHNAAASLRAWRQPTSGKKSAHEIIPAHAIARIDSALAHSMSAPLPQYQPGAASPFRIAEERTATKATMPRAVLAQRRQLLLKGFLIKDRSLAILETPDGSTHICGVGDSVDGQRIMRINGDHVAVKDAWGTYELSQRE